MVPLRAAGAAAMGKSSKGLVVVIAIGFVAAAALALIYLRMVVPRGKAKARRAEVERLGQRWSAVRRCLVGDAPRSSNGLEAAILREMTAQGDVVAELRACREQLPALRREDRAAGDRMLARAGADGPARLPEQHAFDGLIERGGQPFPVTTAGRRDRSVHLVPMSSGQVPSNPATGG